MARNVGFALAVAMLAAVSAGAQSDPFLGKWDITATTPAGSYPYWLEVREESGQLVGYFLNRGGSVTRLPEIAIEGRELVFSVGPNKDKPEAVKPVHRARVENGRLIGELTTATGKVSWVGVRPPNWGTYDANAAHERGATVALFNGRDLTGWRFQFGDKPGGWTVTDGILSNEKDGNNIISTQAFENFRLVVEYRLEPKSNSGIYLRGRYELQVLDDAGTEPVATGHMGIYSRVRPTVNAGKPAGEWQTADITLVGNRVTVLLNGTKVHDNAAIDGITGGALDADEGAPGPIMIQGDHSRIWIRRIELTPIK
jgi:hypothetical protein